MVMKHVGAGVDSFKPKTDHKDQQKLLTKMLAEAMALPDYTLGKADVIRKIRADILYL